MPVRCRHRDHCFRHCALNATIGEEASGTWTWRYWTDSYWTSCGHVLGCDTASRPGSWVPECTTLIAVCRNRTAPMRTLDRHDHEMQEGPNVVVLCRDVHYATTLAHWLRAAGVRVEIVETGRQAKQLLHTGERWVLVTDRVLPPWPGLSRLASLKRSHKLLRIVAIDRNDADSRYVALAAGADSVISPPLRRNVAMRAIGVAEGSGRG